MDMKFVKPSVKLVSSTGVDTAMYEWMTTRPMLNRSWSESLTFDDVRKHPNVIVSDKEVSYDDYTDTVMKMGLQYCNSAYYVFEINCSILFRDFLYNCNETACWANTNRKFPADYQKFTYEHYPMSEEYSDHLSLKAQLDDYLEDINSQVNRGVTELNRDLLPTSMSTHIFWGCSLTQLTSILNVMKTYFPIFYETYYPLFTEQVKIFSDSYISDEHEKYLITPEESEGVMDLPLERVLLNLNMSYSIHAQFLRHKGVITTGYWHRLRCLRNLIPNYGDTLSVSSIMTKSRLMGMLSTRTCSFSQSQGTKPNSWGHILDVVLHDLPYEEFLQLLPCHGCRKDCKYYHDICARDHKGTEKASQCPILIRDATQFKADRGNRLGDCYYKLVNLDKSCTLKCNTCTFRKTNLI